MAEEPTDPPEWMLNLEGSLSRIILPLFVALAAAAVTLLGAATALWAYPYPRGALMILSSTALQGALLAGLAVLFHHVARAALPHARGLTFVSVVLQGAFGIVALTQVVLIHARIGEFAMCARRDPQGICNISIERRATPSDLDAVQARLKAIGW